MNKKEIQEKIIPQDEFEVNEEEKETILKYISPGTNLRNALNGIIKAKNGALIVVENAYINQVIDGGFRINTRFTPQKLIELSKMDGAIILSKNMKRITHANVTLVPNPKIKTYETGTRHKAAERTAKQLGTLVIAVSERKQEISLFYKNIKHPVISTEEILRKTNEYIQLLEKQRDLFDKYVEKLNFLELRDYPSLKQAINVIQKGQLINKIEESLRKYIIELGKEGSILNLRLKELTGDVKKEKELTIKDYNRLGLKRTIALLENLSFEELMDDEHILEILGYDKTTFEHVSLKGWRILSKTSLHESEIALLINEAGTLKKSLNSTKEFYKKIFEKEKGETLYEELKKIKMNSL